MMYHNSTDIMTTESKEDYYDYGYENGDYVYICETEELLHTRWILPTLYSIFFLVGFLGNVLVIAVVTKRSSRRADTFILNLAVSDLFFVLTLPLWATALAQDEYWSFGVSLCKASSFIIAVTRCASSLMMAVMSVDRYVAVVRGKKMHPLRTRSCSLVACSMIWVVSILIGSPSLVFRHLQVNTSACVDPDKSSSSFILPFKMVVIFFTFVLPFAVVLFCYGNMAKYLWNYFGKQVRTKSSARKPQGGHSWLRIVSCVVGAFCLSWLPFNTLNTVAIIFEKPDTTCSTRKAILQAIRVTSALAFANSCSNPLMYALLDAGFRRRAQLSLPRLFLTCRSLLPIPGWSMPTASMSMKSTSTYTDSD